MPPLRTFFYLFCAFIDILSSQNKNFPDIFRSFGRENQLFADFSSCFAIEGPRNGGLVLIKKRNFQPIGFIQKKSGKPLARSIFRPGLSRQSPLPFLSTRPRSAATAMLSPAG